MPTATATPTATPTDALAPQPWNVRMSWWTDHDIDANHDGSHDAQLYYRVSPENRVPGAQLAWDDWGFNQTTNRTNGVVVAQAVDSQGTLVNSGDWLVIDAYIFFDPQVKRYVVSGIVTGTNQDYFIVPVVALQHDDRLVFITPNDVQPVIQSLQGGRAYHVVWDMSALVTILQDQLDADFVGSEFAGIDYIRQYTRTQLPGQSPYIAWDYWGVLDDNEYASNPWRNESIWQWFVPRGNAISQTTGGVRIVCPPRNLLTNPDGSSAVLINAGGFDEQ